jgi:hypothetical protein
MKNMARTHRFGRAARGLLFRSGAIAGGILLLAMGIAQAQGVRIPRFAVPDESSVAGLISQDAVTGDFTGDGRMDAAVGNLDGVVVLAGNGAGRLGDPIQTELPGSSSATALAEADFDEDGDLDLVAATADFGGFGDIFILLGNGDGTFTVAESFPDNKELLVATADFDLDGNVDFAASSAEAADIDIRFGDGAGNFPTTRDLNPPFDTFDFAAADMEGDGDADLFGASAGTPFSMLNNGDGTFAPAKTSPNIFGIDLTVDHFDADELLDVAVGNASDGTVFTGLGNPDGTFTMNAVYGDLALQVDAVASGDVTGDGRVDLLANGDDETSNLLVGRGDGTFRRPTMFVTGALNLATARMNGDAPLDVLALTDADDDGLTDTILLTLGGGGQGLRAPRATETPTQGELGIFEADYNNDGRLDLMFIGSVLPRPGLTVTESVVFLNQGRGRFGRPLITELDEGPDNTSIGAFVVGDANHDGTEDIVGVFVQFTPFQKNLVFYMGNGDGTFQPAVTASPQVDNDDALFPLKLADVTEDGLVDVVTRTLAEISVLPGNGDGTFDAPIHSGFSQAGHSDTVIADFTGDGHLDLVVPVVTGGEDFSSSDVHLEAGSGDGTFTLIQTRVIDTNIGSAVTEDFNGDGRPDAAMIGDGGSNGGRAGLWVFLNDAGLLGPGVYYPRGQSRLEAADFNLDGAVDLATSALLISLNDGAGGFDQVVDLMDTSVSAAGDFTQDGRPDIVSVVGFVRHAFALYVNITPA